MRNQTVYSSAAIKEECGLRSWNQRKNLSADPAKNAKTAGVKLTMLDYFRLMTAETGIPYQKIMNDFLNQ